MSINLILLVRSSPLPNLIAVMKLQKEIHRICLVYSEENKNQKGTESYAGHLEYVIKENLHISDFAKISLSDISSASSIHRDLSKMNDLDGQVHLNYTGGTKAMAVHVYRFLENKYGDNFSASYLDVRNHILLSDYDKDWRDIDCIDLRKNIHINIKTLLVLHGYEEKQADRFKNIPYANFAQQVKVLGQWMKDGKIEDFFFKPLDDFIRPLYKKKRDVIKKTKMLIEHFDTNSETVDNFNNFLHKNRALNEFLSSFGEQSLIESDKVWSPATGTENRNVEKRLKHTLEFLDGKWLETLVALQLEEWARKQNIPKDSYGFSLEGKRISNNDENYRNFELDAFIIYGYQLIGISITTDKGSHTKSKGFEIIHRVKQIGGEEARAILITGYKDKINQETGETELETLKKDLSYFTGTSAGQLDVIGQKDWLNIGNILDHIIQIK